MTNHDKYNFDTDFQQEILQFVVTDIAYGYKAIPLFESHYFTLIEHMAISEALKKYYDKKFIVPSQAVLKDQIKRMLRTKAWEGNVDGKEYENILKILKKIYLRPVKDAETIYDNIKLFAQFSAFKSEMEAIDLNSFDQYQAYSARINKAVNLGTNLTEDKGMFFIKDAKSRIIRRADNPPGHPTPWRQINDLLNNKGTSVGNIITIMGEEKKFKTGFLINTALGYLRRGKVVLYADLENGENSLGLRLDQNVSNVDRQGLLQRENDKKLLKMIRRYARFGGELIVKRFPAGTSTVQLEQYIDNLYREHGLVVTDMFIDYPDIMGDTLGTGAAEETKKIGQVYLDLKNLGDKKKITSMWCPSHITRDSAKAGKKRRTTDQAKSQDKSRHADMNLSIEQDDAEREAGIMRVELVSQRDGPQDGRAYFSASLAKQKIKELSKQQVEEIEALKASEDYGTSEPKEDSEEVKKKKKKLRDL